VRLTYVLGINDQLMVRAPEIEELNEKAFRVDNDGNISFPLVGPIRVSGMSVQQLEAELMKQLAKYFRAPKLTITVIQYRGDPVFFVGAFRSPGIYPLQGRRTLVDMLAVVGGLQPNASRRARITRRLDMGTIPLATAVTDTERRISTVEISLTRLMETVNPEEDIVLQPYDVVRVGTEEMVYVTGEVGRTGAIPITEKDSISLLQVLSLSGGLSQNAAADKARILRPVMDSTRRAELRVNIRHIIDGTANDFPLLPNDVLIIPRSRSLRRGVLNYVTYAVPALATSLVFIALR
jgi:polysaccharide biosynthesis/export protein